MNQNEENDEPHFKPMSARDKKMFDLQMKLNVARTSNKQARDEEERKSREYKEGTEGKRAREEWKKEQLKEDEQVAAKGLDPEKMKMMNTPAREAEFVDKKKRKKEEKAQKGESFGWQQYNPESQYNSYKKRVKNLDDTKELYEKQKAATPAEDFYPNANNLSYGKAPEVPKAKLNKMVDELLKRDEKKENFSRRREHFDDAYVDYVNERNKVFNKKISRAFDSYTAEIKQNLERGTAI